MRSVDFCRVQMYWHMGKRIFEEEQQRKISGLSNCERNAFTIELDTISHADSIDDPDKRMYYELESVNNGWTARAINITRQKIKSDLSSAWYFFLIFLT